MSEKVRIPFTFVVKSATWRPDSDPSPDEPTGPTLTGLDGAVLPIEAELDPSPVIDEIETRARRNYFEEEAAEAKDARKRAREEEAAKWESMPVSSGSSRLTASLYGNLRQRKQMPVAPGAAPQADTGEDLESDRSEVTASTGAPAAPTGLATAPADVAVKQAISPGGPNLPKTPFLDDDGHPMLNYLGQPIMRSAGRLDPHDMIATGSEVWKQMVNPDVGSPRIRDSRVC